jgi:2-keto-4-pentenoate hydratase
MSKDDPSRAAAAAAWLMDEHRDGRRFQPFAARLGLTTLDDAYAAQRRYVGLQMDARRTHAAGYKIGLTSARMQALCGIDSPVAGVVLADRVHASGAALRLSDHGRMGLEFEIAVRIGRPLAARSRAFTLADVQDAVTGVAPAIEVVDDRGCDYATLDVRSLVADNAWNAGIVVGAFQSNWPPLDDVVGEVRLGAAETDRGCGRDVLGHPLAPVAWLANHLAQSGRALAVGDLIMTGSLVTTKFPTQAQPVRFEVSGLGAVTLDLRE